MRSSRPLRSSCLLPSARLRPRRRAFLLRHPLPATPAAGSAWIRFGHFVPDKGPVDVEVDGTTIGRNLAFRDVTDYASVNAGATTVTVVSAAAPTSTPIVVGHLSLTGGTAVTVAAVATTGLGATSNIGNSSVGIGLQAFTDDLAPPSPGKAEVRVIHTVPGTPRVTAQLTAASVVPGPTTLGISPVGYGQASPYVSVNAGTYQVNVKALDGNALIYGHNWPVTAGTVSSIVVVQAPSGPTLEVLSDSVGAASTPQGGMETGLGGTAPRPSSLLHHGLPLAAIGAVFVLALMLGTRNARLRRRLAVDLDPYGTNTRPQRPHD